MGRSERLTLKWHWLFRLKHERAMSLDFDLKESKFPGDPSALLHVRILGMLLFHKGESRVTFRDFPDHRWVFFRVAPVIFVEMACNFVG